MSRGRNPRAPRRRASSASATPGAVPKRHRDTRCHVFLQLCLRLVPQQTLAIQVRGFKTRTSKLVTLKKCAQMYKGESL